MSTRSRIAVRNGDGTFTSSYCHYDGYPEGVGSVLAGHYTDPAKVAAVLALGDLSTFLTVQLAATLDANPLAYKSMI